MNYLLLLSFFFGGKGFMTFLVVFYMNLELDLWCEFD